MFTMKKLLRLFGTVIITICVILLFRYTLYSSDATEGWVADIDTGEPLKGVHVSIEWDVHSYGLAGGTGFGVLKEMHTITDKNGYFYFPAWGPVHTTKSVSKDPITKFTTKGYKTKTFSSGSESFRYHFSVSWEILSSNWCGTCRCEGKTVFLEKEVKQ
jgi:hypothetical protein